MILGKWLGIEQAGGEKKGILATLTDTFTWIGKKFELTDDATEATLAEAGANVVDMESFKAKRDAINEATVAEGEHVVATEGAVVATEGEAVANATLAGSFKALWASMKPVLAAIATNPLTWMIAAGAAAIALEDFLTIDYSEAHEALEESSAKYEESASSLESLNSELETTQSRMEELQALSDAGTITLAEQAELETLQAENEELERKIELQEKLLAYEMRDVIDDAKTAAETGDHSVAQSVKFGDSSGKSKFKGEVGKVTDSQAVKEDIEAIEEFNSKIEETEEKVAKAQMKVSKASNNYSKWLANAELSAAKEELEDYHDSVETLESDLATRSASIQENLDKLKLDPTKNKALIEELEDALYSIDNMDLTGTQKDLKALDSYFDGSIGRNAIKDKLEEAVKKSKTSVKSFEDIESSLKKIAKIDVSDDESVLSLLFNNDGNLTELPESVRDAVKDFQEEIKSAQKAGVDFSKTKFGNIDLNNRQAIEWNYTNLSQNREAIMSWEPDGSYWEKVKKEYIHTVSTVLGGYETFDGVDIAFSPMLQTEDGAKLLTSDTVMNYIETLISEASEDGTWTNEELLSLDEKGIVVDGERIKGLIADIGDTAKETAETMHYLGKDGSVAQLLTNIADVAGDAGISAEGVQLALDEMGLTLDDLNVDSMDSLVTYLTDVTESASEAKKSVQEYAASVSDVEEAFETDNQDSDWSSMSEKWQTILEDHEEGKTGTDDYQKMAEYLNPALLKKYSEKKGNKYSSEAYRKTIEQSKKYANRWFGEDEETSMQNFVSDLKGAGLFDVEETKDGFLDITSKFKTTSEAAKELGMSASSIETMLDALRAYGYDEEIDGITFSTDNIEEYKSSLNGIEEIYDSMDDGDAKDRLGKIIKEANKDLEDYEDNLDSLPEKEVVRIELEYDLATIQQEIERLQREAEQGGDSNTWAELNADKQLYRDTSESRAGNKISSVSEYNEVSNTIETLKGKLSSLEGEQKTAVQEQISNLYDLQNGINDAFADSGLSWNEFIKTDEYKDLISDMISSSDEAKQEIAELLDIDVEDLELEVDADTSDAEDKIEGVLSNNDETIVMNIDATTEEIKEQIDSLQEGQVLLFTAEVDGEVKGIQAIKNVDGSISYVAEDDGVYYYLEEVEHEDGTITYTVGETPTEVPVVDQTVIRDPDDEKISEGLPSLEQEVERYGYNPPKIFNDLPSIEQKVIRKVVGFGDYYEGTAHTKGTIVDHYSGDAYAKGNIPDDAFTNNRYRTKKGEVALTGELGQELVVHGNKWWTVGDRGAEFTHIPSDSIVFDANQTRELLQNGSINSRARALKGGTAHVHGTAYLLSSTKKKSSSGSTSGSNNNNNNNNNKTTTTTDPEEFDWIERKIKAIETAIDRLKGKAEATYKSWSTRNTALSSELTQVKKEISAQEKAYSYYMKKANSVKFSSSEKKYRDLVANGKISISSIKDENLAEKIKKYQDYYDKAQDCKDAIQELNDTVAEIAKQKFENIMQEWEDKLSDSEYEIEKLNAQMELLEEQGYEVDESYYKKLISEENNNIANLKSEKSALEKSLNEAVKNGSIKEYSEDWYALKNEIRDVDIEIINGQKDLASYNNELRQIKWDAWEKGHEVLEKTRDELETMLNLLDGNDLFDEDTGEFTDFGIASQGIHVLKYQSYMDDVKKYADEIKAIKADLDDDPNNTKLQEKYDELIEKQRDAAEGAKSEQDAIKDLASEYNDALLDALNKIIDKRKEALDDMSSLLDYERDVTDQTKNIASLEKQLMAAKADKSEAGRAKAQRLQEELDEAKKDLEQTEYDKWVEDQEKMLDNLANDYEDFLSNRLENTEKLISDAIDATNNASTDIRKTLAELASSYGLELSDDLKSLLKTDDEIAAEKAEEALKNNTTLPSMTESPSSEPEKVTGIIGSTSPSTAKNKDATTTPSTKNTWGSWFIKKTYSGKKTKSSTSIVDRLQYFNFDSSFSARAKYYEAMGLGKKSAYKGTAAQNTAMIKAMKKNGYKDGGTIGNLIKSSGESGFVLARTGEEILSLEKIEALRDAFEELNPIMDYFDSFQAMQKVPSITNSGIGEVSINIGDIQMYGVNDPETFAVQLKDNLLNNQSVKKIIQSDTIGIMSGKNTLSKFKY